MADDPYDAAPPAIRTPPEASEAGLDDDAAALEMDGGAGPGDAAAEEVESIPPTPGFAQSLAFYDVDRDGKTRAIRSDLQRELRGMVQFVQSHAVQPKGNAALELPSLVASRAALVLFTPRDPVEPPQEHSVTVKLGDSVLGTVPMRLPTQIFASDSEGTSGRPQVLYSKRAFSAVLPWDWVQPGMALQFERADGLQGILPANEIEVAAPARLIFWGVRLGMLTDPPINEDSQPMLADPARAASDYFETSSAAQVIVASYEDVRITRAMVKGGTIYNTQSADTGDVYSGDLREQVGKSQFSTGINLANYGVPSSALSSQSTLRITPQFVYHHSAGNYANGRVTHGLSGGNAIGTLYNSTGNEWSHEVGHHYGLGHYPGQDGDDYFWAAHHADSGWGFIAHRNRMRTNLAMDSAVRSGLDVNGKPNPQSFAGLYSYMADAMSGGGPQTAAIFSRYTHYTGYTAKRAQQFLDRPWFDASSSTGYTRHDAASRQSVPAMPTGPDGKPLPKAERLGVHVFTLLGGYDPSAKTAVMYPPARANYGNTFALPEPDRTRSNVCWLEITSDAGVRRVTLRETRHASDDANKFHVNVAVEVHPTSAAVKCRFDGSEQTLDDTTFPTAASTLSDAVVVGMEHGFEALAKVELPDLDRRLSALSSAATPVPDLETQVLIESWSRRRSELSASAREVLTAIRDLRERALTIDAWMTAHAEELAGSEASSVATLLQSIADEGFADDTPLETQADALSIADGRCISTGNASAAANAVMSAVAKEVCGQGPAQRWLMDASGRLHSAAFPGTCLTERGRGQPLVLETCSTSAAQRWNYEAPSKVTSQRTGLSLDVGGNGELTTWPHNGGTRQTWSVPRSESALLAYLGGANVGLLFELGVSP